MTRHNRHRRQFLKTLSAGAASAGFLTPFAGSALARQTGPANKTGYFSEDDYTAHVLSADHYESPERLIAIKQRMSDLGIDKEVSMLEPLQDTTQVTNSLLEIHTQEHIDSVDSCETTGPIARKAAAAAIAAVKAVHDGTVNNAFCPVRPPGHHSHSRTAHYDGQCQGEGFCFYNNVAIAARFAQRVLGYNKILIADWDYHHGNATQDSFYSDDTVLFFSTHNWNAYPGTGDPSLTGQGKGAGYNINVHLDCGCIDNDIIAAWDDKLIPKANEFKPDFVLLSAGFDSRINDYLGCFSITDAGYVTLTKKLMQIAADHCSGRLVSLLEGGYNTEGLAHAVTAHVETLLGKQATSLAAPDRRFSMRDVSHPHIYRAVLYMPPHWRGVCGASVMRLDGRTVCRLPKSALRSPAFNLRTLRLGMGRYYLMFENSSRERVLPFEIVR
jgi:acetoin utilization deacetylase AcuC-like enzyme